MSTLSLNKKPVMTLEQRRSEAAWRFSQEGTNIPGSGSDYINLAKAAPALIMNNGLMQTLAFYADKDPGFLFFMEIMLKADSSTYRQATEEALLLLRWIRQFAAALGG